MRRILIALIFAWLGASAVASAAPGTPYYLALGDSLALGVQPRPDGTVLPTVQGYVDNIFAYYKRRHPNLHLAKLGCSGERTSTMIAGGVCSYPLQNQLAQAVAFLQTHRVLLVTITIGGDDVLHCISPAGIDLACVQAGAVAISSNLPQIIGALRAAAGPHVPIVAANYYDPFLGAWVLLPPPGGQTLASDSLQVTVAMNGLLEGFYTGFGVPVADVARAYHITDFANVPGFNVPLNVFLALTWTWIGAPPPRGPDIHPNAAGYAVIAGAFIRTIGAI